MNQLLKQVTLSLRPRYVPHLLKTSTASNWEVSSPNYSISSSNSKENPGKVVFISQSTDVYANLAFEDWLYSNWTFEKRNILFLWRNNPCVVIGRHQNPYVEANIRYLMSAEVPIVRRNSGGGTVYHDEGNLNCTFFSSKKCYNRKWNLDVICDALSKDFNIEATVNKKHDIIVGENLKVSGTAAKLGGRTAYHHCTVLVSADKSQMKLALDGNKNIDSKATKSVQSPVTNLQDLNPAISVEKLLSSIGKCYLEKSFKEDDFSNQYQKSDGFTLINPMEDWFPGLDKHQSKLRSREWLHGMTPLFTVAHKLHLGSEQSETLVNIEVYHGIIQKVSVKGDSNALHEDVGASLESSLKGLHYNPDILSDFEMGIGSKRVASPRQSTA